jgi:DNA helicase HerA-like ATPase
MTLPFSSSRLGLAVASERRGQPIDELIEPQLRVDRPRPPPVAPAPADLRPSQAEWAKAAQAEIARSQPPDVMRQPLPLAPAPQAPPPLTAAPAPPLGVPPPAPRPEPPVAAFERAPSASDQEDRRLEEQPAKRILGNVIAVNGARATIATKASSAEHLALDAWGIGKLISINLGASRIVGMVYEMKVESGDLAQGLESTLIIQAELVGEVLDSADNQLKFRRGIANYPWLGAPAHRIRSSDLRAVFDLGDRQGVEIGRVSQDESIPATVSVNDMLSKHFAVVGTTGVGKSSAVSLLVRKAVEAKPELRVLVLDPHNEYAHAFRGNAITLDVNSLDLPVWLFRFDELTDVIYRGRPVPDAEADLLRELIPLAKSQFAAYSSMNFGASLLRKQADGLLFSLDAPSPYRMLDLLGLLDEMMGKLDQRHDRYHMRVLKGRLEALVTDARYRFMFGKGATEDNLESIIGRIFRIPHDRNRITVLQLAGLPSEVLNAVVSILSRLSFEVAMWSSGGFEVLVLCEEAHRYVPQDLKLGFAPTRQAIARIAKEGRKYGCYIGVVTQRPGELDPTILSQCSTVFAMRLANDRDQDIIRSALSDSSASQISFLSAIGNREAIAFGEGVATPMRMKFTYQEQSALPAAETAHRIEMMGVRAETSLRSVVAKMRGQTEPGDL